MTLRPVMPQGAASVRFSGERRRVAESMVNSLFPAQDKFDRADAVVEEKILPWYERIGADWLHVGGIRRQREVRQNLRQADALILDTLDRMGLSKNGGLKSPYWNAYHFAGKLFGLSEKMPLKQRVKAVEAYRQFVNDSYVPFLMRIKDNRQWWMVDFLLIGMAGSPASEQKRAFETMVQLSEEQPELWDMTLKISNAYQQLLTKVYFGPLMPTLFEKLKREHAIARSAFVSDVIRLWLEAVSSMNGPMHPLAVQGMSMLLPEALDGIKYRRLRADRLREGLAGTQADLLTLLWRMLVQNADLRGIELDSAVSDRFRDNIITFRNEAALEPVDYTGPDLPVTHCNLEATVPKAYRE